MRVRASKLRYIGTRNEQQDFVNVFQVPSTKGDQVYAVGILTDGIGGLKHGKEAGALVNDAASRAIYEELTAASTTDAAIQSATREAAFQANRELREFQVRNGLDACGSTLVICVVFQSRCFYLSIGDSIILTLGREKDLNRINTAHVRRVDRRATLSSAVLGWAIPDIDQGKIDLSVRGVRCILLSSDGLSTINREKVRDILHGNGNAKLNEIVQVARANGGARQDNLAMILLEVE